MWMYRLLFVLNIMFTDFGSVNLLAMCLCWNHGYYRWNRIIGIVLVLEPWLLQREQNYWHCACVGTMVTTEGTELLALCLCWNHGYYIWNIIIGNVLVLEHIWNRIIGIVLVLEP